jgi:hypothetical protein
MRKIRILSTSGTWPQRQRGWARDREARCTDPGAISGEVKAFYLAFGFNSSSAEPMTPMVTLGNVRG